MKSREELVEWLAEVRARHQEVLNAPCSDTVIASYLHEGYVEHQRRVFRDCLIGFTGKDYQLALEVLDGVGEDQVDKGRAPGVRVSGAGRGGFPYGYDPGPVGAATASDEEFTEEADVAAEGRAAATSEVSSAGSRPKVPPKKTRQRALV